MVLNVWHVSFMAEHARFASIHGLQGSEWQATVAILQSDRNTLWEHVCLDL